MTSIRRRLLVMLLTIIALVGAFTLVHGYRDARHEVQELFDAQLAQSARVLQAMVLRELNEDMQRLQDFLEEGPSILDETFQGHEPGPYGHPYERKLAFQVWNREGELLLHSVTASRESLSGAPITAGTMGFTDALQDGMPWRVFSLWDSRGEYLIQVGERYDIRDELTHAISQRLVAPWLIALPLLAALIWFGVGRGLAPLHAVTAELRQRAPRHLEPMQVGRVPDEVRPLVEALNALFALLREAFVRERRFTADAAHELRTPLAALKTQAQVALRATHEAQRERALRSVILGVDRAAHLVEQLLTLSRMEPDAMQHERTALDLSGLTAEVLAEIVPAALDKTVQLDLDAEPDARVLAEPVALRILIRNLADNAVRYTPPGGTVIVRVHQRGEAVVLSVLDTGPGINPALRERVRDRFFRVAGTGESGCGLGLSIVQRIADLHGASLHLSDGPTGRGLDVEVRFAAAPGGARPTRPRRAPAAESAPER